MSLAPSVAILFLLLVLAGCSDETAPPVAEKSPLVQTNESKSSGKRGLVFREHKVTDPGMNNMVALTFLVPEGWKVEGGISNPGSQYYSMPFLLDVKCQAPDGRQLRQLPAMVFEFNYNQPATHFSATLNGNMYLPLPESPSRWIMEMAQQQPDPTVSELRVVSEEPLEELTEQLRRKNSALYDAVEQGRSLAMQTGIHMQYDAQVTKVVLRYRQDGIELEEAVLIAWQYLVHTNRGQVTHGMWSIDQMLSMRGPVGTDYQNDPQLLAIFQSARPNPAWVAEMNRFWSELARIRHQGAMQRQQQAFAAHQKRMQTLNATSDIISSGWRQRSAIREASQAKYIDSIHEVTPYQTAGGETVKLPSFYDHVYTDGQGRYILNNDALYDPNTDSTLNQADWQRLEPQR